MVKAQENEKLTEELHDLQQKNEALLKQLEANKDTLEARIGLALQRQDEKAQVLIKEKETRVEQLQLESQELLQNKRNCEGIIEKLKKESEEQKKNIVQIQLKIKELQEEKEQLIHQTTVIADTRQQLETNVLKVEQQAQHITKLEQENRELLQSKELLEATKQQLQLKYEKLIQSKDEELKEKTDTIDQMVGSMVQKKR